MNYPKLVLRLLLFLILISFSFCKEKKTGFVIPMEGARVYSCNSEFLCNEEYGEDKIPYAVQIEYYTKEIKTQGNEVYYESKYNGKSIFLDSKEIGTEPMKYYFKVFPLAGASLRSKDDKEIQKINYGEKVEFIRIEDNGDFTIKFKDTEGIINKNDLVELEETIYFKVSTFSGLNLRDSPDMKSKVLITLPYQTVGEVLEADKIIYTIQKRKGYWMKIAYENKTGWIFSGFVFISTDRNSFLQEEVSPEQRFFPYFSFLEEIKPKKSLYELNNLPANATLSKLKGFYFIEKKQRSAEECSNSSKLYLVNPENKIEYAFESETENILSGNYGRIFFVDYEGCHCCCSYGTKSIYFVLKNKLLAHTFDWYSTQAPYIPDEKCGTKIQSIRYSEKNSDAYIYTIYGDCELKNTGNEATEIFKEFTHNMFIKIKINDDDLDIKRIIDKGIPAEYKQEWEEAEVIWKKGN